MDRDEALRLLRDARVGTLATLRPDDRPHVVPFVFAVIERSPGEPCVVWAVDHKPKRTERIQRLENIRAHPAVELCVDGYDEDWTTLWWVRASGIAREVSTEGERLTAVGALRSKYEQYARRPPGGPVVAIDIDRIVGWRASEGP
jgi:PPOX class probable F420-dependent enzyme